MDRRRILITQRHSELPSGYIGVKYIESTGIQYIDTGLVVSNNEIQINAKLQFQQKSKYQFFGAYGGLYFGAEGSNKYNFSNKQTSIDIGNIDEIIYKVNVPTQISEFWTNGISQGTTSRTYQLQPIYLFDIQKEKGSSYSCYVKLYDLSIYIDGIIVRNFIPCLDSNDKPCLYDTVGKQTFYNQGTGEFLYG